MATLNNDVSLILKYITESVRHDTEHAFDALKKELVEKLDRERDMIVAGTTLNIMKYIKLETMGENIVITLVKKP